MHRAPSRTDALPPFELLGPAQTAELDIYVRTAQLPPVRRRPILVQGEVGTWKTRWALCLHQKVEGSVAFVRLHCGLNTPRRVEDLLFGALPSARGSSAWQRAVRGTLLLEEIHGLSDDAQIELAERLGRVDRPQVIATTSSPLDLAVRNGNFDAQLYRLLARQLVIAPPLVRCRGDILRITESLLQWQAETRGTAVPHLSEAASRAALEHDWQGNLHELESRVERALLTTRQRSLAPSHLGLSAESAVDDRSLADRLRDYERRVLTECLAATGGDLEAACHRLGLNRRGLLYRLKKHDVEPSVYRS